jgi:hypothetical protein
LFGIAILGEAVTEMRLVAATFIVIDLILMKVAGSS